MGMIGGDGGGNSLSDNFKMMKNTVKQSGGDK